MNSAANGPENIVVIRARVSALIDEKAQLEAEIAHRKQNQLDATELISRLHNSVLPTLDNNFRALQTLLGKRENW
jgi:hypothetical protein